MSRRKFSIHNVKVLQGILSLIVMLSILFGGAPILTVKAASASILSNDMLASKKTVTTAKLSKKNKQARKAYQKLLAKKEFKRTESTKFTFALIDLDGDGIDELLVDSGGDIMADMFYQLYTFKEGKVKELLNVARVPFDVYEDGTVEYGMGQMGDMEYSYYKLKNGTLHKRMQLFGLDSYVISESEKKNAEYRDGFYWTIRKIGKKTVSYDDCQKWMKKFHSSHKVVKLKYYKNTAQNRKLVLGRD